MTEALIHREGCAGGARIERDFTGRLGDPMRGCVECGSWMKHEVPPEPLAPIRSWSMFRCRTHHDEPVRANGKGCRVCAPEMADSRRARKAGPRVEKVQP